jgi:hypothetical protein
MKLYLKTVQDNIDNLTEISVAMMLYLDLGGRNATEEHMNIFPDIKNRIISQRAFNKS